jgi:CubicO group peptidase (beta-lactamase class C family)
VKVYLKRTGAPGLAATVSVQGKIVWSHGFGLADVEQNVPVNPARTKFRIASISKPITATVLARLYEQGKIQLDSSIYFYLPNFPVKKYRPTLKQLAGHLGGVRHYRENEFLNSKRYATVTEGLTIFQDDSLLHAPGTKYQYSSYSFNLLSAAMEKASGKDFVTLVNDLLIRPYHLTNITPDYNDSLIAFRSRFYEVHDKHITNSPSVDNSNKWAGGGFLATSEELIRFGNLYLQPGFLKKETIDLFTSPQKFNDGTPTGYGLGWSSAVDKKGRASFGHSGGAVGGSSNLVIYPKEKVVVVILTNYSGANLHPLTATLAELFLSR